MADASQDFALWSAVASAIAAAFSALAALVALRFQRQTALDSVRPELEILGWSRPTVSGTNGTRFETLTARCVKNIGPGTALHLRLDALRVVDGKLVGCMTTRRIPLLAPAAEGDFESFVVLPWDKVEALDQWGTKTLDVQIQIEYRDYRDQFHRTTYEVTVFDVSQTSVNVGGAGALAQGLFLRRRITVSRAAWSRKLRARLSRFPLFGRALREWDPLPR